MFRMAEKPETLPSGVTLTSWDDFDSKRKHIFDAVKDTMASQFPQTHGGVRLELHDLDYVDPEHYTLADQKQALMGNKYLHRRLRGTYKLYDDKTNQLLDQKEATVMRVPYLTDRGTFLNSGNEITTNSQSRLMPGAYVRRKESGEIESHFNPVPSTGRGFRVRLEPDTGLMKMEIGQSDLRLYSLLHDLDVPDEDLEKRWGKDLLATNKKAYDARVFEKAYQRLVRFPQPGLTRDEKKKAIQDAISGIRVNKSVLDRTLPNRHNEKLASAWREKQAGVGKDGCLMAVLAPADAATIVAWAQKNIKAEDLADEGIEHESHATIRFGFKPSLDVEALKKFLKDNGSIKLTLGKVERFEGVSGGTADAMVVKVTSPDLIELRGLIDEEFVDDLKKPTHAGYRPHLTLGYVKPGKCKKLDGHARFDGHTYVLNDLVYSSANSKEKTKINIA